MEIISLINEYPDWENSYVIHKTNAVADLQMRQNSSLNK